MERAPAGMPGTRAAASAASAPDLHALRDAYPQFRIWHDLRASPPRYIARRLDPGPGLHTVVTSDLAELRTLLAAALPSGPDRADRPPTKKGHHAE